jgi:hypothetical protein
MPTYRPLTLFLLGITVGLLGADIFAHWNGWDGPPTLSMVATFTGFGSSFYQMAKPKRRSERSAPQGL